MISILVKMSQPPPYCQQTLQQAERQCLCIPACSGVQQVFSSRQQFSWVFQQSVLLHWRLHSLICVQALYKDRRGREAPCICICGKAVLIYRAPEPTTTFLPSGTG